MSPSTKTSWSEAESSFDLVAFRAVPTTLYLRARNARTIPAPMPCDAPVTITVLGGLFIVTLIKNPHSVADRAGGRGTGTRLADRGAAQPYLSRFGSCTW